MDSNAGHGDVLVGFAAHVERVPAYSHVEGFFLLRHLLWVLREASNCQWGGWGMVAWASRP